MNAALIVQTCLAGDAEAHAEPAADAPKRKADDISSPSSATEEPLLKRLQSEEPEQAQPSSMRGMSDQSSMLANGGAVHAPHDNIAPAAGQPGSAADGVAQAVLDSLHMQGGAMQAQLAPAKPASPAGAGVSSQEQRLPNGAGPAGHEEDQDPAAEPSGSAPNSGGLEEQHAGAPAVAAAQDKGKGVAVQPSKTEGGEAAEGGGGSGQAPKVEEEGQLAAARDRARGCAGFFWLDSVMPIMRHAVTCRVY